MRLVSHDPISIIWQTLARYESRELAKKLLLRKSIRSDVPALSEECLEQKAIALAYCLRNAKEYCSVQPTSLTTAATLNYYGCIWLAAATAVANPTLDVSLASLEESSKSGHGLRNLPPGQGSFPDNECVYISQKGLFVEYLKWTGLSSKEVKSICMPGAYPETVEEADQNLLIRLPDLFARIPELWAVFQEISDKPSVTYSVGLDSGPNQEENMEDAKAKSGAAIPPFTLERTRNYSWIAVYGPTSVDAEFYTASGLPLVNMQKRKMLNQEYWSGKLFHPPGTFWTDTLKVYRSPQTQDLHWIQPLLNKIADPIALHLILLYHLSILARYRPAIWREILEGRYDAYRSLILSYNDVLARVVPQLVLERIIGAGVRVSLPGTLG